MQNLEMTPIKFLILSIFVPAMLFNNARGSLLMRPKNTEAVIGSSVQFCCRTSGNHIINWDHIPVGSRTPQDVYLSGVIITPYDERFSIAMNRSTGDFNLTIRGVQLADAGRYECTDEAGQGEKNGAELTVLESLPYCKSSITSDDIVGENDCGVKPDDVNFECHLNFSGNIPPGLDCKVMGEASVPQTIVVMEKAPNQRTFQISMKSSLEANNQPYICETSKSKYKWTSSKVHVSYVLNSTVKVSVNESSWHSCLANSSQPCIYRWLKVVGDKSTIVSINKTVYIEDQGLYICQADCSLKENWCTIQPVQIDFVVRETRIEGANEVSLVFPLLLLLSSLIYAISTTALLIYLTRLYSLWKRKTESNVEHPTRLMSGQFVVQGMAVINKELFIIRRGLDTILVFQSNKPHSYVKEIKSNMFDPRDIVACASNDCLFITDAILRCIWKLEINEKQKKWLTEINKPFVLSINSKDQIIKPEQPNIINVYNLDATFLYQVIISENIHVLRGSSYITDQIREIQHALQLPDGNFIICHGEVQEQRHEVLLIAGDGVPIQRFGRDRGSELDQLNHPRHIAVGSQGEIFVADKGNNRVVRLDQQLNLKDAIMALEKPIRLCYYDRQLLVGQYRSLQIFGVTSDRLRKITEKKFETEEYSKDEETDTLLH